MSKFNRGDYVKISGLVKQVELNGKEGIIRKQVKDRYEVEVIDHTPSLFSLRPQRLEYLGQSCVVIGPCNRGISPEDLPIYTSYLDGGTEYKEIQELKSRFGWNKPHGMAWKSKKAKYTDLYIYYDSECKETINELADFAFPTMTAGTCCPSHPVDMPGREEGIRGSIVIIRQEPPKFVDTFMVDGVEHVHEGQRNFKFDRYISHEEMREMFSDAMKLDKRPECTTKQWVPKDPDMAAKVQAMKEKFGGSIQFHDPNDALKFFGGGGGY